jgi:mannose-6-phosphate isomerase-like protein (cupin superfamily)
MLRYPAETLGLILHKEVFFVKKDGARRAEKAQRGDLHFHEKGQIGGGVTVSSSTTYDVLDIVAPDVVPVEVVETDRSLRQPVQAYAYAAARAQLSAQTGPVRRVTVLQSAHITAELLRLTANASLHVDAGRSVLFPVEGGVTVVSGGKSSPLSTHAVFIAEPGEKFRLLPAGGKPLYLLMITVGG